MVSSGGIRTYVACLLPGTIIDCISSAELFLLEHIGHRYCSRSLFDFAIARVVYIFVNM
jgi:hypothetical protein